MRSRADEADGAALLRAVLDDPADDLPRLAYADWLEEQGQAERAEFIRVQVRLAAHEAARQQGGFPLPEGYLLPSKRFPLRDRERALLLARGHAWLAGLGIKTVCRDDGVAGGVRFEVVAGGVAGGVHFEVVTGALPGAGVQVDFARGFLSSARCPLAAWLAYGPALAAAHPLGEVRLSDREPADLGDLGDLGDPGLHREERCGWDGRHNPQLPSEVPPALFAFLRGGGRRRNRYPSPAAAHAGLSEACIAWARARGCSMVRGWFDAP